jgi:hypothetical protein
LAKKSRADAEQDSRITAEELAAGQAAACELVLAHRANECTQLSTANPVVGLPHRSKQATINLESLLKEMTLVVGHFEGKDAK